MVVIIELGIYTIVWYCTSISYARAPCNHFAIVISVPPVLFVICVLRVKSMFMSPPIVNVAKIWTNAIPTVLHMPTSKMNQNNTFAAQASPLNSGCQSLTLYHFSLYIRPYVTSPLCGLANKIVTASDDRAGHRKGDPC